MEAKMWHGSLLMSCSPSFQEHPGSARCSVGEGSCQALIALIAAEGRLGEAGRLSGWW